MRSLRPAGRVVSSEPEGVGEGRGVWGRVLSGRVEKDRGAGPGGGSPSVPAGLEPVAMTALRVPRRLCWLVLTPSHSLCRDLSWASSHPGSLEGVCS